MKYCIRTIIWKFRETPESIPELKNIPFATLGRPEDVYRHYRSLFENQVKERFVVFWLNSANKVLGFEIITEGILNTSLAHPREVFRGAIVATAASIILAHNHPSENPEFSAEDLQITRQIVEAGKILGIPVHDHVLFAGSTYTSFAERGLL